MQHLVRGVEHGPKQLQLPAQDVEREALRRVVPGQEVDHHHVSHLTVAVAAADALLDALRVPGQIIVDDRVAELQVQALRARLRRDQDPRTLLELVHEREPHRDVAARAGAFAEALPHLLLPTCERRERARRRRSGRETA